MSRKFSSVVTISHDRLFGSTESYTDTRDRIPVRVRGRDQKRAPIKAAAGCPTPLNAWVKAPTASPAQRGGSWRGLPLCHSTPRERSARHPGR